MYTVEEVIQFIEATTCIDNIQPEDDLFEYHGIYGADWSELLHKYMQKYHVDMDDYIWHYHNRGEGGMRWFDPIPYVPVKKYIPITAAKLTDFANKGKWDVAYPPGAQEQEKAARNNPPARNTLNYILLAGLFVLVALIWYWSQ